MKIIESMKKLKEKGYKANEDKAIFLLDDGTLEIYIDHDEKTIKTELHDLNVFVSEDLKDRRVESVMYELAGIDEEEKKMTNTLTIDQLQELLQIQKEFDDRIPTRNLNDTVASMIIEFVEWINTLEFFKNWKKQPGKPLDTQLDEIADYLAFSLQLTLTIVDEEDLEETTEVMVDLIENEVTLPKLHSVYFVHVMHTLTEQFVKGIDNSIVQVLIMPFLYANTYYSIDQLINAYKKKMKRNHERQDGTADAGKGYV